MRVRDVNKGRDDCGSAINANDASISDGDNDGISGGKSRQGRGGDCWLRLLMPCRLLYWLTVIAGSRCDYHARPHTQTHRIRD